jgi:hypothetical protein
MKGLDRVAWQDMLLLLPIKARVGTAFNFPTQCRCGNVIFKNFVTYSRTVGDKQIKYTKVVHVDHLPSAICH